MRKFFIPSSEQREDEQSCTTICKGMKAHLDLVIIGSIATIFSLTRYELDIGDVEDDIVQS